MLATRAKTKKSEKNDKNETRKKIGPAAPAPGLIFFWFYLCCFSIFSDLFLVFARVANIIFQF